MSWRCSWPRRSADESTRASEHSMRSASCVDDISSENTRHGQPVSTVAAFCASDSANEVLPIAGRAARMMSSVGCRPAVCASRSAKPVGTPVMPSRRLEALVERAEHLLDQALERLGAGLVLALRDLEDLGLGVVEVVADLEAVLVALLADLARREDELAGLRVVADDLGVARRRCRRSGRAARARRGTRCRRSPRACPPSRSRSRA